MKTKFVGLTLTAALGFAFASGAFAQADVRADALQQQSTANQASSKSTNLGTPANGGANRVVNLDKNSKYLNVKRLETVQINIDGKSVTWKFDTLGTPVFSLSQIIPGAPDHILVYVSRNTIPL